MIVVRSAQTMIYSQIKRLFSISFLAMMGLGFFMITGERVGAQQFIVNPNLINPKPTPLPIIPGNTPPVSQTGGNGNTPKAGQQQPVNPGFPWLPGTGVGSGSTSTGSSGITIDYTCPLLDQDGNSDLMASLDALAKALPMKDACKHEDTNFNDLYQKQNDMFKSAAEIKNFMAQSNNLWSGEKSNEEYLKQINGFTNQISSLMSNVGSISESLGKNELLNSSCGSAKISKGKALHALSDLILQISPYAIFAANVGADMTLLGPVITGFTGLASLVNTVSKLNRSNSIDMSDSENRLLVMKATCEYMRIEGKLRFLRQAKLGTKKSQKEGINKLNHLIDSKDNALKELEKSLISKEGSSFLVKILEERTDFYNKTKAIRDMIKLDWNEYIQYDELRNSDKSDSNLCTLGKFIVEDKNEGKFPYRIATTMDFLEGLSSFNKSSLTYKIAKMNFHSDLSNLENKINSNSPRGNFPGAPTCGGMAQEALNKVAKLLQVIEELVVASEKSYEEELKKNEIYKEWYQKNGSLNKERENLKGIVNVITITSQQMTSRNLSELNTRLELLRHTLFGTRDRFPIASIIRDHLGVEIQSQNYSPLGSWFEHTAKQLEINASNFDKALKVLLSETKEELKSYIEQEEKNAKKSQGSNWGATIGNSKNNKDYFQYITLKTFPKDSSKHKVMCTKLSEVATYWEDAKVHMDEMKNVCTTLRDYINIKTGEGVLAFCGMITINRNANTSTFINTIESDLESRGLPAKAYKVNQKYSELECF